jgi:hypothetical protein
MILIFNSSREFVRKAWIIQAFIFPLTARAVHPGAICEYKASRDCGSVYFAGCF